MYLRALTICEKKRGDELGLDPRHVDRSFEATIATNLASMYLRQGHLDQAESLYKRAEKIWRDYSGLLGKKHPNTVGTLEGLAELYGKTGRDDLATPLRKRAAAIAAKLK
jgi:tetratricopeptide (TPR) repeat protein